MNAISRCNSSRNSSILQEQFNRLLDDAFPRRSEDSSLTAWVPPVDIVENENELILKADLPAIDEKELDIRVENNTLTIRGERKFQKEEKEQNYLRVERAYGAFTRSFALPNTVNTDAIRADYNNGVLSVQMPKRAESKPKQVKVSVNASN